MDTRRAEVWFLVGLLILAIFFSWLILKPYLDVFVLAGTLGFIFRPLYKKLSVALRYESLAAFASVIIVALVICIPLVFFGFKIFAEASALYTSLVLKGGSDFALSLGNFLHTHFTNLPAATIVTHVNTYVQQALGWFVQNLGQFFSSVAQVFFLLTLILLGLFYSFKDGAKIKKWVIETAPLSPNYTEEILRELGTVAVSVVRGTLIVALMVGVIMGIGFFIFAIPNPLFWAAAAALSSIVPVVGPWLVLIPSIAYLYFTGHTLLAIGLFLWSLLFTNIIYSVISPQLMHRGIDIHPYLILLSILGGIALFGPVGFITGPLMMALLLSLLRIYKKIEVR
jgi:predicted PurR-regulated permease PerM